MDYGWEDVLVLLGALLSISTALLDVPIVLNGTYKIPVWLPVVLTILIKAVKDMEDRKKEKWAEWDAKTFEAGRNSRPKFDDLTGKPVG